VGLDSQPLAGVFVLLVEDDAGISASLSPFLEYAGALVHAFPPATAPAMIGHIRPDAVVVAVADELTSATIRTLRAADPGVPLIAVSTPDTVSAARAAGADEVVSRPLNANVLGETIWRVAYGRLPARRARPCVLVAEDHDDSREMLTMVLRDYDVVLAADGDEAITQFQRHRPDVVILDVLMPVKDGIEAILAIRRLAPEARIIAMSGGWSIPSGQRTDAPDLLTEARQLGADVTLRKPLEPRLVLEAVQGLLAR